MKQLIKYAQVLAILGGFRVEWPDRAKAFFDFFARFCIDLGALAGSACLMEQQSTELELGFRLSLIPVAAIATLEAMVVLGLCRLALSACRPMCPARVDRARRCFSFGIWEALHVLAWGLTLFYATLLQFSTAALTCVPSAHGTMTVSTFPH